MASLCKSQQCSIERRGFRQELDSWRHKLIHCVGFETILEGLFGPALLNDLSVFKDCEPTGVYDWSFDENCLFCCLRRQKVKEHLAGFHKPIHEPGQENFLKQEQAKIIRLETQAEEFINAVFYKKDCPRISDPNIPLVAREIMQRMIRQFAAEYTSKNSSTQDSSPPNSTKNQSLPKSPSGQSSPPPATTQNPVLSKLLMADQDSPLDLTVKKPHLEEPCEQADGVLDLSTKKSPCSGSPNSCISPSTSNTIGNGIQDTPRNAIDPNNSTSLSLEMFMAKLCSHHQKQFILVLNNLCTEEYIMKSTSRSASVSEIENANIEGYDHSCSNRKANPSLVEINKSASESCLDCHHVSISTRTDLHEDNYYCGNSKADHGVNVSHPIDPAITNNTIAMPPTEEKSGIVLAKISEVGQTVFLEHAMLSHSNSALNMVNDFPGSELPTSTPKIANKENTQYINPKQTLLDCGDSKLMQENSVTGMAMKLGNLCEGPFQNFADLSGSALQKVRMYEKHSKTVACKSSRVLTNECDKQCDVVYISEPITTECHFENPKSVVCPRNTARKSTRGYLFGGDCCELSTVRTLVRSAKVEDKVTSALHTLIIPNGLIETLPSTGVVSLIQVETNTFSPVPQNDETKETVLDSSRSCESENHTGQHRSMELVDGIPDSLVAVFSLAQDEPENPSIPSNHGELALNNYVEEIPKTCPNSSVVNIDAHCLSINDHEKSVAKLTINPDFVTHSNNLGSPEHSSANPSLDMEVISSKSEHDTAPPKCYPHNTTLEETCATLQYSHASPSILYSSSFPNKTADKDLPGIGSTSLNDSKILSEAVIDDPTVTSDQQLTLKSETIKDVIPILNSGSQLSKTSQVDPGCSGSVIKLQEHTSQSVDKENVHFTDLELLERVKDGQSLALNRSVKMETEEDLVLHSIATLRPSLTEPNCPAEHFRSPLNTCAKIVENINVKLEANVLNKDLCHCDATSSSGCDKHDLFRELLKTKEVIGENGKGAIGLDEIDNSLISNTNSRKTLTPSKRHKKVPAPTDRCLRSREAHVDSFLQKIPSLQVILPCIKDTNSAQRCVEIKTEDTPFPATVIDSSIEETSSSESYFAVSLNSHCREGTPLLHKRMLNTACLSRFKMSKHLKIDFKIGCDKRVVSFAQENHHCLKMANAKCKCSAKSLSTDGQLRLQKCNEKLSENDLNSISQTRSTKPAALKTLKDKMNCKSDKLKSPSTENKQINYSNKQKNIPKFIDWCSEEENQERISSFNDTYTTVHTKWIPLERETANVTKSKNKADKLKEIWKTKKRVRRPKSIQDQPTCSPVQSLFMNSFKLSDVCRWFMETTETKSLVIVKKLNTRLPEEHQLPMIQSPKYPIQNLYPHMLQAQRLKKHLKKFASVFPARNDITQNSLNKLINSGVPLTEVPKDTVKGPNDCQKQEPHVNAKKTAPIHIVQKYSGLRENLKYQSCTVSKSKKVCVINAKRKTGPKNIKGMATSELGLQNVQNSVNSKSVVIKDQRSKKRSKNDTLIETVAQPRKKRKIEAKQGYFKNRPHVNTRAFSTKAKDGRLRKIDLTSNSQAPKRQVGKAGVYKTSLRKGKAKTPMQKQSRKPQLVLKCKTRSAKLKQVPPNLADSSKIASLSSSHRKKGLRKKICAISAKHKIKVASQVRHRKPRSQLQPTNRKGRSFELK
ncbi:ligand-dependent corepressor isoform X1 [Bufo gargarizans]|uniref:ligand-dependent corepressor isoform X1 n=2 Tax=Bufo gargarizans TaxID=30331 RepID=UPI001CF5B2DA|nr:ligand-dependent corepressor isoform X1 [Bufo gargarizans]